MRRAGGLLLALTLLACAAPAAAQDSAAPPGALPHWLPTESWVYEHWLPYDESRLYAVLGTTRGKIWHHLRDDKVHNLGQLARARGLTLEEAARRLVAPRRGTVSTAAHRRLVARARRTLTQGHMSQHILFHSLHQLAIPNGAKQIFGLSREPYLRLRRAELSPSQIGRLAGRTHAQILAAARRALRASARRGVREGATTQRQSDLLLDRQLRQLPRFLGQSRYNGPPQTTAKGPLLPPNDFANNPTITADGASVVFDAYRATIPEAKTLGEIRVVRYDVATSTRHEISHAEPATVPRSAYNSQVSGDGSTVVYEQAEGNKNFGKRYGAMHVLVQSLLRPFTLDASHEGVERSRTAYNPSVSADGAQVVFEASDDRGRGRQSANALWLRDTGTGAVRRLAGGKGYDTVFEPQLSGDGRTVVFTVADGRSAVYALGVDDGRRVRVANDAREPAVSHDGSVVAYVAGDGGVRVRDFRSGVTTRLTGTRGKVALDPAISADGRHVAFAARGGDRSRIYAATLPEARASAVSPGGTGLASAPAISADGRRITYTTTALLEAKPLGTPGVVLADLDAASLRLLSTHDAIKAGPGAKTPAPATASAARHGDVGASFVCTLAT